MQGLFCSSHSRMSFSFNSLPIHTISKKFFCFNRFDVFCILGKTLENQEEVFWFHTVVQDAIVLRDAIRIDYSPLERGKLIQEADIKRIFPTMIHHMNYCRFWFTARPFDQESLSGGVFISSAWLVSQLYSNRHRTLYKACACFHGAPFYPGSFLRPVPRYGAQWVGPFPPACRHLKRGLRRTSRRPRPPNVPADVVND